MAPFGNGSAPFRFCQVHDDVPAMTVNGLAFRHTADDSSYPAHSVTIDVWVSTAATTADTLSAVYDNNHGPDKTQVVVNRTYNLPASDDSQVPRQFTLSFPFDVPFVYAGSGSLCWEVHVLSGSATSPIFYDAGDQANANPPMGVATGLAGCRATGRTATMHVDVDAFPAWQSGQGALRTAASNLLSGGVCFVVRGFDRTMWSGLPLPATIPGSLGAPSGTCSIHTDVLTAELGLADHTGRIVSAVSIPLLGAFHGLTLNSQVIGLDLAANPTGVTASNLGMHNIVAPHGSLPAGFVLNAGLGPTGFVVRDLCLVTRFF